MKLELIQPGNKKLGKNIYMWNMTTSMLQCGRICKGCYAAREEHRWPNVAKARAKRYEASLQPDFVDKVTKELSSLKTPPKYFRIHASSEFYSQEYVDKWVAIVEHNPSIVFYTYTKRLNHFDFSKLKSLSNMVLIDSLHFGGLNYGPVSKAPENAFVCPDHKKETKCGETCTYCMDKSAQTKGVFFVQH